MLAEDNEYLQEAAESLYVANSDEIVRQQCQAREDAEKRERTILRDKKILQEQLEIKEQELKEKTNYIKYLEAQLAKREQK